jgi:hypothetical protein
VELGGLLQWAESRLPTECQTFRGESQVLANPFPLEIEKHSEGLSLKLTDVHVSSLYVRTPHLIVHFSISF